MRRGCTVRRGTIKSNYIEIIPRFDTRMEEKIHRNGGREEKVSVVIAFYQKTYAVMI